jgi:hypothetical protein
MAMVNLAVVPLSGALGAASAITIGLGSMFAGISVPHPVNSLITLSTLAKSMLATSFLTIVHVQIPLSGLLLRVQYAGLLGLSALALAILGTSRREDLQPFAL